jgi:amidase
VPFANVGAAAGYPTVAVPAGYVGNDPVDISFLGTAWSEPHLLAYADAFERLRHRRIAPTELNPSLVPASCGT